MVVAYTDIWVAHWWVSVICCWNERFKVQSMGVSRGFLISTYERDTLHRNGNDEWLTFRMGTCVSDGVFELV